MIDLYETGIYIAFPTTSVLKPIYRGYKAQVNNLHTKVGIARTSFRGRERQYQITFGGEVEFFPVLRVSPENLPRFEKELLRELYSKYLRVGRSREWFETADRDGIISLIVSMSSN